MPNRETLLQIIIDIEKKHPIIWKILQLDKLNKFSLKKSHSAYDVSQRTKRNHYHPSWQPLVINPFVNSIKKLSSTPRYLFKTNNIYFVYALYHDNFIKTARDLSSDQGENYSSGSLLQSFNTGRFVFPTPHRAANINRLSRRIVLHCDYSLFYYRNYSQKNYIASMQAVSKKNNKESSASASTTNDLSAYAPMLSAPFQITENNNQMFSPAVNDTNGNEVIKPQRTQTQIEQNSYPQQSIMEIEYTSSYYYKNKYPFFKKNQPTSIDAFMDVSCIFRILLDDVEEWMTNSGSVAKSLNLEFKQFKDKFALFLETNRTAKENFNSLLQKENALETQEFLANCKIKFIEKLIEVKNKTAKESFLDIIVHYIGCILHFLTAGTVSITNDFVENTRIQADCIHYLQDFLEAIEHYQTIPLESPRPSTA